MTTITIDEAGRLTIPEEVRVALGIAGGGELDLKLASESGWTTIVLRPHIPEEDSSHYSQESAERVQRSREDYAAGRFRQMSEADLRALAEVAEDG